MRTPKNVGYSHLAKSPSMENRLRSRRTKYVFPPSRDCQHSPIFSCAGVFDELGQGVSEKSDGTSGGGWYTILGLEGLEASLPVLSVVLAWGGGDRWEEDLSDGWFGVVRGIDLCCPSRLCRRLGIGGERFGLGNLVVFSLLRGCGHVRDDDGNTAWLEVATERAGGVWSALLACALLGLPGVRSPYTSWFRKALIY